MHIYELSCLASVKVKPYKVATGIAHFDGHLNIHTITYVRLTSFSVITKGTVEIPAFICRNKHVLRHLVVTPLWSAAIFEQKTTLYGKRKGQTRFVSTPSRTVDVRLCVNK